MTKSASDQFWEDAGLGPHRPATKSERAKAYGGAWVFMGMITVLALLHGGVNVFLLVALGAVVFGSTWLFSDQPARPAAEDSTSPDR
jgi:hypothetical protein